MNKTNHPKSWFQRVMAKVRIEKPRLSSNGVVRNDHVKGKLPKRVARPMQPVKSAVRRNPSSMLNPDLVIGSKPKA